MADPASYDIKDANGNTVTFTPNADPAKGAKQDTGNGTLAEILAKIIASPATAANQQTEISALAALISKDFATQTTLAAVLAKLIAAPATEAKQDTMIAALAAVQKVAGVDGSTVASAANPVPVNPGVYPLGATALVNSTGILANTSGAATLTPGATKTAYISGFAVSGAGATAALPVTVALTGLLGGTLRYTYTFVAGVLLGNQPLIVQFDPPLPASAINTAIVVTCPASGAGGTNNTVVAYGFQL